MNMEQIRHALDELSRIKRKGGTRSRGITVWEPKILYPHQSHVTL
jgi:hypothetical protein